MNELARFFAMAWRDFLRFQAWEGPDLQDAILESGLGEWREAEEDGTDFARGEMILVLTEAGRAAIEAAKM